MCFPLTNHAKMIDDDCNSKSKHSDLYRRSLDLYRRSLSFPTSILRSSAKRGFACLLLLCLLLLLSLQSTSSPSPSSFDSSHSSLFADDDGPEEDLRSSLLEFFASVNPSKKDSLDLILSKYKDDVKALNAALRLKYGEDLDSVRAAGYKGGGDGKVKGKDGERAGEKIGKGVKEGGDVGKSGTKAEDGSGGGGIDLDWNGGEELGEFGNRQDADDLETQLVKFFKRVNPEKVITVKQVVEKYARDVPQLNAKLMAKYGTDLNSQRAIKNPRSMKTDSLLSSSARSSSNPKLKSQLVAFFKKHNAHKIKVVDDIIIKYGNNIDAMNAKLKTQYKEDLVSMFATQREKQAITFFNVYRPGESQDWCKGMAELYGDHLDNIVMQNYGARLDLTPVTVNESELKARLEAFYDARGDVAKKAHAGEMASLYASKLKYLNEELRASYGIDLNGKRGNEPTPPESLHRVLLGETKRHVTSSAADSTESSAWLDVLSKHVESSLHSGRRVVVRRRHKTTRKARNGDHNLLDSSDGNDVRIDFDTTKSSVSVVAFGLPFTGEDVLRDALSAIREDFKGSSTTSEAESILRLQPALDSAWAYFDVFQDRSAVIGLAPSYFFQEMIAAYPHAVFVVTVREFEPWWADLCAQLYSNRCRFGEDKTSTLCKLHASLYRLVFGLDIYAESFQDLEKKKIIWQNAYEEFYDRVLGLVPREKRIVMNVFGDGAKESLNHLARTLSPEAFQNNAILFSIPRSDPFPKRAIDPLNRLHFGVSHLPKKTSSLVRVVILGMDVGSDRVANALKMLGMSGAHTTSDWIESLNSKCKESYCRDIVDVQDVWIGKTRDFSIFAAFASEAMGGAPITTFARQLALASDTIKFVLSVKPIEGWLKNVNCFLLALARPAKKSLLRSSVADATSSLPLAVKLALVREFGFDPMTFAETPISEHLLKRRYQDFVDRIARVVPPERLLVIDPSFPRAWSKLCSFLGEPKCFSEGFSSLDTGLPRSRAGGSSVWASGAEECED